MIRLLTLVTLLLLQGCVVQAAMDAMHRWGSYHFVTARQIDATHFRVVIGSMDLELWQLTLADQGVETRKEGALVLETDEQKVHALSATART